MSNVRTGFLFLVLLALASLAAVGADESAAPDAPLTQPAKRSVWGAVDVWHERLGNGFVRTVDRFDRFFGDEALREYNEGCYFNIGLGLEWDRDEGPSLANNFDIRLAMPNLDNRIQFFLDSLTRAEDPQDISPILDSVRDIEPDAGMRYILTRGDRAWISTDAGIRFANPLQLYGKLRGRYTAPLPPWELRLSETLMWFTSDGFGSLSEVQFNRILGSNGLFRASTHLEWQEHRRGVRPAQTFAWYWTQSRLRGHQFTLYATWPETPNVTEADYRVEYGYRRRIHRDWIFLSLVPGIRFPQALDYEPTPYITIMIEALFGQY